MKPAAWPRNRNPGLGVVLNRGFRFGMCRASPLLRAGRGHAAIRSKRRGMAACRAGASAAREGQAPGGRRPGGERHFPCVADRGTVRDLPERVCPCTTVCNRFSRWAKRDLWLKMFETLAQRSPQSLQLIDSAARNWGTASPPGRLDAAPRGRLRRSDPRIRCPG